MAVETSKRKVKCSFTLSPETAGFLRQTRRERKTRSDSETLDLLLRELLLRQKEQQVEAAYTQYYDSLSEEDREEQSAWAKNAATDMWIGIPE
ncbi:MAG TPA: hypothetical protein VHZ52_01500 [Acidobacteriaceae bacterium]|jgi:hypothetical protein|nr:hypothetical protein [Acidobacteriaceae bacterium]